MNETLVKWDNIDDSLAPLSSFQRCFCLDLGEEVSNRPTPTFPDSNDPEESVTQNDINPIETSAQFLSWYSKISDEWMKSSNSKYEQYLNELRKEYRKRNGITLQVENTLHKLCQLKVVCKEVSDKTDPIYELSRTLLSDQTRLSEVHKQIDLKLCYFRNVDSIKKRLDSPTFSISTDQFTKLLDDIDSCIQYFKDHELYKESGIYLMQTRHCLSRVLSCIKSYIIGVMDTCKTPVAELSSEFGAKSEDDPTNKYVANYGRFQSTAPRLKNYIGELENRIEISSEYDTVLTECQRYYISLRDTFIQQSVNKTVTQLTSTGSENCLSLLRSCSNFLIYLCQDEDKLYYQFFSTPSTTFLEYIESVCSVLYDIMRPIVIHTKHLETLGEICSILRVEIVQEHIRKNPSLQSFGNVAEQLLQDVQERLVFRAHLYFKTDILEYHPSPGDLAYPEKLEMMRNIAEEIRMQEAHSLNRFDSRLSLTSISSAGDSVRSSSRYVKPSINSSPVDLHGMWYPTVRRTLVCLSRLYRCVEKPIFQGLAQEAIKCCTESVMKASDTISINKSVIDGQLFQIKHLLILREQIAPFQVDFTVKEMTLDFTNFKTAAYGLWNKHNKSALLEFILYGSPLVRENYLDSRKIVDSQLKYTCEQFIEHTTQQITHSIEATLDKIERYIMAVDGNTGINEQEFGKPEYIRNVVQDAVRKIKSFAPTLQNIMALYLGNPDTLYILFKPIKNNIVAAFSNLLSVLNKNYSKDDQLLIGCPSPEQVSLLLSATTLSSARSRKSSIDRFQPPPASPQPPSQIRSDPDQSSTTTTTTTAVQL